mgnify:CR=1 FL=1
MFWQTRVSRDSKLYEQFHNQLAPLVNSWAWSESVPEAVSQAAKADLSEFLRRAKKLLPKAKDHDWDPLSNEHDWEGFIRRMLRVQCELDSGKYHNACHELYDVVHFDCIQERKILYAIIMLLEAYLH